MAAALSNVKKLVLPLINTDDSMFHERKFTQTNFNALIMVSWDEKFYAWVEFILFTNLTLTYYTQVFCPFKFIQLALLFSQVQMNDKTLFKGYWLLSQNRQSSL